MSERPTIDDDRADRRQRVDLAPLDTRDELAHVGVRRHRRSHELPHPRDGERLDLAAQVPLATVVELPTLHERTPPRLEGVPELWDALEKRSAELDERGELEARRERNLSGEVEALAVARVRRLVRQAMREHDDVRALVEGVQRREVDPVTAVAAVVDAVTGDRAP